MSRSQATSRIYVGAPVEQDSERRFLTATVEWLEEREIPFIGLANLHIGGRQIDFVLATAQGVSVVEVKSSYLPVRGSLNGCWERYDASGKWRDYTNAYNQALTAKNALRDEMKSVKPVGSFYPDGHVVFTSGFAEGSQMTAGDFKVAVTTLDQFLSSLSIQGESPWSLKDWEAFATKLSLTPVTIDDAAASLEDQEIGDLLRQYNTAFVVEYGRDAAHWLSEDSEQQSSLLAAATTGAGCFVSGPSGCGKTLMAKWVAVETANRGDPTIFFAAKDFSGSWSDSIKREVGLVSDMHSSQLMRAIARSDRPVFLVLDGINELGSHRSSALRGIRALAKRLGARLIITSQEGKPSELAGLDTVSVRQPSAQLKRRIAQSAGATLSATALEALNAVSSGIEAEIIGHIGDDVKADLTRLALLDQYIRARLGTHARAASFGLRRLASAFLEQVAFSTSESNFDEFMKAQDLHFNDSDALFDARLLIKRAGRVSFSHEMIQNICAAFDLARKVETDPEAFGLNLSTPILEGISGDVISAIEDASVCRTVLEHLTNPDLLLAASNGDLGLIAGSITRELLDETANACRTEVRSGQLELVNVNDVVSVDWANACRRAWSEPELARLHAIGCHTTSEEGLSTFLELCAEMDRRLAIEWQRLVEVARAINFPLRSRSFALAYYGFGNQLGFTAVARAGLDHLQRKHDKNQKRDFNLKEMSSGQLHFVLESRHSFFGEDDEERFAEDLIYLFQERFRWEPYHVQLATLHASGFVRRTSKETLERLVRAIHALDVSPTNLGISTAIVDALKFLGALDEEGEEARESIKRELTSVLVDEDSGVDQDLALSLCMRMFDHPFDSIYGQEVYQLNEDLRRRLFRRALGAPKVKTCSNLVWLAMQVASYEDASDMRLFQSLAKLPDPSNPFPQQEWGGFVLATRFLGRHRAELPTVSTTSVAGRCLTEVRTLVYEAESTQPADAEAAQLAWKKLHAMPAQLVIGCLSEVQSTLAERHFWREEDQCFQKIDLAERNQTECLQVSRRFIQDGENAKYFHRVPAREKGPSFAFDVVTRYGDRSDLEHLRKLSRAHPFARHALAAIKSLDAVPNRGP